MTAPLLERANRLASKHTYNGKRLAYDRGRVVPYNATDQIRN